jgi:phenylacetate-CoA ligase
MIALQDSLRDQLHRRRHPWRFALLDELLRNQALSREQLQLKQRDDLARIIAFAAADTDYYAQRFAGISGNDGHRPAIAEFPVLRKEDVIANLDAMLARGADRNRAHIAYTGGSTGKPLAYYWDAAKHELMRAGMMRSYMGSGWRPGERIINFWGAGQDIKGGGLARKYAAWVSGETTLAAREFSESELRRWATFVQSWRPVLLQGYASILAALARYVIDQRLPMPNTLRGVYSTAEVLTAEQREIMQRAFGCKVFNQYGSREIPNIACECRHGNMHVFSDMVYLESVALDGEEDRLLVTSLTNRLMPMIRYDIGDSGRLEEGACACGSPFPLMEMGMCRKNDLIRTPGGRSIHPSYFNGLLYGMTAIRQYQFVQTGRDRIVLNLVAGAPLDTATLDSLREKVRREIDAGMTLEVNYVEAIPRTASGKHRFVISEVDSDSPPARL